MAELGESMQSFEEKADIIGKTLIQVVFDVLAPRMQLFTWEKNIVKFSTYRPKDKARCYCTRDIMYSIDAIQVAIWRDSSLLPENPLDVVEVTNVVKEGRHSAVHSNAFKLLTKWRQYMDHDMDAFQVLSHWMGASDCIIEIECLKDKLEEALVDM